MTRTVIVGMALVAGMVLLIVVVWMLLVEFDRAGKNGSLIGVGVGLLNLGVGYLVTRRSLRRGMKSAMATLLGGFFIRLLLVVSLVLAFHRTEAISEIAFALVFMAFFFAYVLVEIVLVERSLSRRPA